MPAPSRVGTPTINTSSANRTSVSFSHTTTGDTDLLLVTFILEGGETISGTPQFNSSDLTLIRDTGSTSNLADVRVYVYGMVSPGAVTANITATFTSNVNPSVVICRNWADTETASVVAATNFISEDVNFDPSTTSVLTSGGSSGNTLYAVGGFQGANGAPVGWSSAAFSEITEGTTGPSTTSDFAYADAEYTTLPAGTTITWSSDDENTAVLIELVALSPPSGTGAQTVPTPTQSATGGQEFTASAAQTVPTPSQSATGGHEALGTGAQTVPTPTQDSTGTETFAGSAAQTVATPTQAATGVEEIPSSAAQTAPTPSQTGTGAHEALGTGVQTTPTPTQLGTGTQTVVVTGSGAQTAPTPLQSATGGHEALGTGAQTAPTPTQSATGAQEFIATGAQAVPTPSQVGTGEQAEGPVGTGAQVAPTPSQVGTGAEVMAGIAAQLLPELTQVANAIMLPSGIGAQTVPTPTQGASGSAIAAGGRPPPFLRRVSAASGIAIAI